VDLDTGERGSHRTMSRNAASRVDRACAEAAWHIRPPPQIFVHAFNEPDPPRGATITLQPTTGVLRVSGLPLPWTETRPLADGRPVLQGCIIEDAQGSGDIVVVRTFRPDDGYQPTLRLLGGLEGAVLWEKANFRGIYALSRGPGPHRLARQIADSQVAVADVLNPSGTVCVTPVGKCHNQVEVELGQKEWLGIQVGHWVHLVRWDNQELTLSRSNKNLQTMLEDHNIFPNRRKAAVEVIPNVSQVKYDTHRFQAAARWGDLTAIVDRCGQVAIFDREKNLITMFFIHRDRIAAWMPDGTRLGPPSLTGGPVTPDAAMKIGRALREANARWGEWPP
jgi:hypothetical protein